MVNSEALSGERSERERLRSKYPFLWDMLDDFPVIPWENPEVVWKHPEGAYSVVKCDTQWDWWLEGFFLAHCIGTKQYSKFSEAHKVYSIRDNLGVPHATILCQRIGKWSPYQESYDIGTTEWFRPWCNRVSALKREKPLRVLQVRGRTDDIAMHPYLEIAQQWFVAMGGAIAPFGKWNDAIRRYMDTDKNYHFRYLLDETANHFDWTWWNLRQAIIARLEGSSL